MSEFMENRLPIFLLLLVFLIGVNSIQYFMLHAEGFNGNIDGEEYSSNLDVTKVIPNYSWIDYLTFNTVDFPQEIQYFLTIIQFICIFVFTVITISYIYDVIKALPFT